MIGISSISVDVEALHHHRKTVQRLNATKRRRTDDVICDVIGTNKQTQSGGERDGQWRSQGPEMEGVHRPFSAGVNKLVENCDS